MQAVFTHPLVGGLARVTTAPTNAYDSDQSASDTVRLIQSLARQSAGSPEVAEAVSDALQGLSAGASDEAVCRRLYLWVKQHITYIEDERLLVELGGGEAIDRELLIRPDLLLSMPQPMGDCDDHVLLIAAMLERLGIPYKLVTVAADDETPERMSHIYLVAFLRDSQREFALDAAGPKGQNFPGNYPKKVYRKIEWQARGNEMIAPIATYDDRECAGMLDAHSPGMAGSGLGVSWGDVLKEGASTGFDIVKTALDPRFKPGTYSQTTEQGQVIQTQAKGPSFGVNTFPALSLPSTIDPLWLIAGGLGLFAILAMSGKK